MRLKSTSLAAIAVLALSSTAVAASTTRNSRTVSMKGTTHLSPGAKLTLVTTHNRASTRIGVKISYDVKVRSKTVLGFAVYPCRSTACKGQSTSRIALGGGTRHVDFNGSVPFVKGSSGKACVYAQLRDLGPRGHAPGEVVRSGTSRGVLLCQSR